MNSRVRRQSGPQPQVSSYTFRVYGQSGKSGRKQGNSSPTRNLKFLPELAQNSDKYCSTVSIYRPILLKFRA